MPRSILITYFLIPLLSVTFVISWIGLSSPMASPQPKPSSETAQHAQSAPAVSNPESMVKFAHHGPNHPPVLNKPVEDRFRVVQFPMGPGAVLEFEGEPATDQEMDVLDYRFGFAVPGKFGIRSPREALLRVTRRGNRFFIRPHGTIAPARFASVYGKTGIVPVLPAVIYANDGKSASKPVFFTLSLVYDAPTRYTAPSGIMGEYPRETRGIANRRSRRAWPRGLSGTASTLWLAIMPW